MPLAKLTRSADISMGSPGGGEIPESVIFHSDWSTDTGFSVAAMLDTDKDYPWDSRKDNDEGRTSAIVTCASLGLTSPGFTNCMVMRTEDNASGGVRLTTLPAVEVGESRSFRAYMADVFPHTVTAGDDRSFHPFDMVRNPSPGDGTHILGHMHPMIGDASCDAGFEDQWWMGHHGGDATTGPDVVLGQSISAASHPANSGRYGNISLNKYQLYGVEVRFLAISGTVVHVTDCWIYDTDGNVLHDNADFYRNTSGGESISEGGPVEWTVPDLNWTHQQCGSNGLPPQFTSEPHDYLVWGAVVIARNVAQIGPWNGTY